MAFPENKKRRRASRARARAYDDCTAATPCPSRKRLHERATGLTAESSEDTLDASREDSTLLEPPIEQTLQDRLKALSPFAKIVFALSAILGLPSLALASYSYFAGVPLVFLDHVSISNFFLSFYLAVVLSLATARITMFALELIRRLIVMGWIIPRRQARARTTKQMIKWGKYAQSHPTLGTADMKAVVPVLSRYERARLRRVILGEKAIKSFFEGIGGRFAFFAVALTVFCGIFAGFRIVWILWLILACVFPLLRAVRLGDAEHELEGIVKVALYKAAIDLSDQHGATVPTSETAEPVRHTDSPAKSSKQSFFRRATAPVLSLLRDDAVIAASMLRSDIGLAVVLGAALALGLGSSKFRSDFLARIEYNGGDLSFGCVAPLMTTANHFIVYDHSTRRAALLPHDSTSYFTGERCDERSGAGQQVDETPAG